MTTDDSNRIARLIAQISVTEEKIEQIVTALNDIDRPHPQCTHTISVRRISGCVNINIDPIVTPKENELYKTYLIALKTLHVTRLDKLKKEFDSITITF